MNKRNHSGADRRQQLTCLQGHVHDNWGWNDPIFNATTTKHSTSLVDPCCMNIICEFPSLDLFWHSQTKVTNVTQKKHIKYEYRKEPQWNPVYFKNIAWMMRVKIRDSPHREPMNEQYGTHCTAKLPPHLDSSRTLRVPRCHVGGGGVTSNIEGVWSLLSMNTWVGRYDSPPPPHQAVLTGWGVGVWCKLSAVWVDTIRQVSGLVSLLLDMWMFCCVRGRKCASREKISHKSSFRRRLSLVYN